MIYSLKLVDSERKTLVLDFNQLISQSISIALLAELLQG